MNHPAEVARKLRTFFEEIERGTITLVPTEAPDDVFHGNVTYHASNGWDLVVYVDCSYWDYVDCIRTSATEDDISFDSLMSHAYMQDEATTDVEWLFSYTPNQKVEKGRYQIGLNRPYHSERVESLNEGQSIRCKVCSAQLDWDEKKWPTTSPWHRACEEFGVTHYECEPKYGPQLRIE